MGADRKVVTIVSVSAGKPRSGDLGSTRCSPDPLLLRDGFFLRLALTGAAILPESEARDSLGEPRPKKGARVWENAPLSMSADAKPLDRLTSGFFLFSRDAQRSAPLRVAAQPTSNVSLHPLLVKVVLHVVLILEEPIDVRLAAHRLLDDLCRRLAMDVEEGGVIDFPLVHG
jgi:hypothetical protein